MLLGLGHIWVTLLPAVYTSHSYRKSRLRLAIVFSSSGCLANDLAVTFIDSSIYKSPQLKMISLMTAGWC